MPRDEREAVVVGLGGARAGGEALLVEAAVVGGHEEVGAGEEVGGVEAAGFVGLEVA